MHSSTTRFSLFRGTQHDQGKMSKTRVKDVKKEATELKEVPLCGENAVKNTP